MSVLTNRRINRSAEELQDGVHLPGLRTHDSQTLCGISLCFPGEVEFTSEKATCVSCLATLDLVLAIARKRSLRK